MGQGDKRELALLVDTHAGGGVAAGSKTFGQGRLPGVHQVKKSKICMKTSSPSPIVRPIGPPNTY